MDINKDKIVSFSENIIELAFYLLLCFVAFSISLVEITVVVMIVFWSLRMILTRDLKSLNTLPVKLFLAYFLWVILSCFNSAYFSESFRGIFKAAEAGMVFLVAATSLKKDRVLKRSLYVLIVSVSLICVNGIIQHFIGYDLIRHRTLTPFDYLRRISSSFVHPNDFGGYLVVMGIFFLAVLMSKGRRLWERAAVSAAFLISMVSLFLTRSRGSWLAFVIALLVLGWIKSKKLFAVIVVLLMIGFMMLPLTVKQGIYELGDLSEGTSWERLMLWKGAVNMIKVHPVLGFGVNTYSRNFPAYKPPEYPDVRYAHNSYLQMASEIGVVGLVLFLIFLASVFWISIRRMKEMEDPERKNFVLGLSAGLIGFAANSAVDTHLYSVTLSVMFYLLMGFCFSVSSGDPSQLKIGKSQ